MIDSFHNGRGIIRPVVAPVKALTTIITLASGGAAGREGPLIQIGASLGSWLSARLRLSASQRRILLLAGTAGGLGAIFRAPLGAAITSVEILYREDFESDALIPCVISSFVAYSIYVFTFGFSHLFTLPYLSFTDVRELLFLSALRSGVRLCGRFLHTAAALGNAQFAKLPWPRYLVVGFGGLLVGGIALLDLRALGSGFGVLQLGIDGQLGIKAFIALATLKIFASMCTVSKRGFRRALWSVNFYRRYAGWDYWNARAGLFSRSCAAARRLYGSGHGRFFRCRRQHAAGRADYRNGDEWRLPFAASVDGSGCACAYFYAQLSHVHQSGAE